MISKPKNLLVTTTFWGVIIITLQTISPSVELIIAKGFNWSSIWNLLNTSVIAVWTIADRLEKDENLYTPKFLPGRNLNEILTEIPQHKPPVIVEDHNGSNK